MAIAKMSNPAAPGLVINSNLFVVKADKSTVMQRANNNRSHAKQGTVMKALLGNASFQGLDSMIGSLDAQYELLPTKTPWENYAANIAGEWQLCANCAPVSSGKKLFRQYNLSRELVGLPVVDTPIDSTEFSNVFEDTYQNFVTSIVITFTGVNAAGNWLCLQLGDVLNNPLLFIPPSGTVTLLPGERIFDIMQALPVGLPIQCCQWCADGAPGIHTVLLSF